MKKRSLLIAACLLLIASGTAQAAITSASVTSSTQTLRSDRMATVRLVWNIRTTGGLSVTVETDDGEYRINGSTVDFLPALPSQTKTANVPPNSYTFTFTETLSIPASLIRQAAAEGRPLVFHRVFTDDAFTTSTDLDATFTFVGGIGGDLDISRMRLAFEDGSTICKTSPGDDVSVTAFVDTEGTGLLRGEWQVRRNAENGSFRTLKTVQVPVQGGKNVEIKSPALPVDGSGRLDVRLHVTTPDLPFSEPIVSCVVAGSDRQMLKARPRGKPVGVISPRPFMPLDKETLIEWQAAEGAKAYRIEVLAEEGGDPVAAQEVKPDEMTNRLSPVVLEKLDPLRRYIVKVYAE